MVSEIRELDQEDLDRTLAGVANQQFAVGLCADMCAFQILLHRSEPFGLPVQLVNLDRFKRMCIRRRRKFRQCQVTDSGWRWLEVADADGRWHGEEVDHA